MTILIPEGDISWARNLIGSSEYAADERSYKVAVHFVVAALLSQSNLSSPRFPELLASVFQENMPDLAALGLDRAKSAEVQEGIAVAHLSSLWSPFFNG